MRIAFLFAVLLASLAFATMGSEELNEAKQLVDSNVSCDKLSDEQLEMIGEYYMEQMHPGERHEVVDRMMGGEGSESLKRAHIQMALVLYCGETDTPVTYGGMMGMMPFMYRSGFGGGTIGYPYGGMMGYDMMGYGAWSWINLLLWILVFIALILVIIWLYRNVTGAGRSVSAAEIVKQRYAKGEISKKQYEEMKKDLE